MTTSNPEPRLNYIQVSSSTKALYVRLNGFHIGMVWPNGGEWQGSRFNTIGQPEVRGSSRKQCAERLATLYQGKAA